MGDKHRTEELAVLLKQTGEAHHEAFAATDGEERWMPESADILGSSKPSRNEISAPDMLEDLR